ncbi:ferric enterobactin transport protein FepE [Striga asiatica]|uniref:Ferric enterobactin transport protein FepE n=1 Tax=Striga asiatica TaxID=4170 RepID=A0A5A7PLP0_STRAF|nr:ferric enterobactin transport protein FepE [Striga asiatica]
MEGRNCGRRLSQATVGDGRRRAVAVRLCSAAEQVSDAFKIQKPKPAWCSTGRFKRRLQIGKPGERNSSPHLKTLHLRTKAPFYRHTTDCASDRIGAVEETSSVDFTGTDFQNPPFSFKMSQTSTTSNFGRPSRLKYEEKICHHCEIKLAVKIVSSRTSNYQKLYYACDSHGFVGWANPINEDGVRIRDDVSLSDKVGVHRESNKDAI